MGLNLIFGWSFALYVNIQTTSPRRFVNSMKWEERGSKIDYARRERSTQIDSNYPSLWCGSAWTTDRSEVFMLLFDLFLNAFPNPGRICKDGRGKELWCGKYGSHFMWGQTGGKAEHLRPITIVLHGIKPMFQLFWEYSFKLEIFPHCTTEKVSCFGNAPNWAHRWNTQFSNQNKSFHLKNVSFLLRMSL